jgi:hypothetical protein
MQCLHPPPPTLSAPSPSPHLPFTLEKKLNALLPSGTWPNRSRTAGMERQQEEKRGMEEEQQVKMG